MKNLLAGNDTYISQQTGIGKSAVFQLLPLITDLKLYNENNLERMPRCGILSCVLIISPLISLMEEQVKFLNTRNLPALYLDTKEKDIIRRTLLEKPAYVFASPESILKGGRDLLLAKSFQERLKAIFVDESHCIAKW